MMSGTAAKGGIRTHKAQIAMLLAAAALIGGALVVWRATKATLVAAVPRSSQRVLAPEESPEATPEQQATWMRARSAFFDEYLATQTRDEAWAGVLEAKLLEITKQQQSLGVTLVSAKCWTKTCRAELSYPGKEQRRKHIQDLGRAYPELPHASFAYPGHPSIQTRLVAYMSKDASSLPPFNFSAYKEKRGVPGPEQNAPQAAMK